MKTGCSVLNKDEIRIAKEAGYDYAELKGRYLAGLTDEEFDAVIREYDACGLTSYGINAYCGPEIMMTGREYDPAKAERYAKMMAGRAHRAGVKIIGIGSPASRRLLPGDTFSDAAKQMKEFLRITAEAFAPFGMNVCLEPLSPAFSNFINTVEEAYLLIQDVPCGNLGIVIDFYNMEGSREADIDLSPFLDRILHAHISDDLGDPYKRSYLLPEKSLLHKERVSRLLKAGYRGRLTLEMDLPADPGKAAESLDILREAGRPV